MMKSTHKLAAFAMVSFSIWVAGARVADSLSQIAWAQRYAASIDDVRQAREAAGCMLHEAHEARL